MKKRVEEKRCESLEDSREYEKMMVCAALGLLKGHRVSFLFFPSCGARRGRSTRFLKTRTRNLPPCTGIQFFNSYPQKKKKSRFYGAGDAGFAQS